MQDRYLGDIGDFGKYSLLYFIQQKTNLKLGVNWYRTDPDALKESHKKDGKFIKYEHLKHLNDEIENIDGMKNIFKELINLLADDKRNVEQVENRGILPQGTVFFSDYITNKEEYPDRDIWFNKAIEKFNKSESELIFLDPDNGLSDKSDSLKHVTISEVQKHLEKNHSVIIYNHCDHKPRDDAWRNRFKPIKESAYNKTLPSIRFRRKSARDYIFVSCNDKHLELITNAINEFLNTGWGGIEAHYKSKGEKEIIKKMKHPHFMPTPEWFNWQSK